MTSQQQVDLHMPTEAEKSQLAAAAGYYNQRQYPSLPQAILVAVTIPILATWGGGWGGYQPGYWGGGYAPGELACLIPCALLAHLTSAALSV